MTTDAAGAADQRRAVEAHATEAFRFLGEPTTVRGPGDDDPGQTRTAYLLPDLFVEVELDWQERAAFVLVGLPVEGRRPDGYYVDTTGRKVRWHLGAVLEEAGHAARARELKRLVKRSGPSAMVEQLDAYATELRALLPDLPDLLRQLRSG